VKNQLKPLLKAWSDAGIKVMLIKGFWLAEFIYERPGDRGYGDIDVLIPENQAQHAIQIAQNINWQVVFNRKTIGNTYSHEEANIVSSTGLVTIDIHRYALQSIQSWGQYHPNRLTKEFWMSAVQHDWEGTNVWLPTLLDGLILNLLNRARGDHWKRRASDLPDAQALIKFSNVNYEQFVTRATELNVRRTILAALQTCNPWINQISSTSPNFWRRFGLYLHTGQEIGIYELEYQYYRISLAIDSIKGLITMLPLVIRVKRELKKELDLHSIFQNLEKQNRVRTDTSTNQTKYIRSKRRGIKLALSIIGSNENACVPRSLAMYIALHQVNIPVEFVSGIRRSGSKLEGHAWLEYDGRPLDGFGDHFAPQMFKENFRYPSKS
jgi:Uncharacterised nucleotidyltransferase/Transglutaminase-like superfamily